MTILQIASSKTALHQMKSAALGLAEGSGAKLSHVLIETSPQQESEKTAFFLAWLGLGGTVSFSTTPYSVIASSHCFNTSHGM